MREPEWVPPGSPFPPGSRVVIGGLKASPEYNGRFGTTVKPQTKDGRLAVQVDNARTLLIFPEYLKIAPGYESGLVRQLFADDPDEEDLACSLKTRGYAVVSLAPSEAALVARAGAAASTAFAPCQRRPPPLGWSI